MKALPLSSLIGVLTGNAIGAETYSAAATLEFIKTAGFTGAGSTGDNWGELRYITFSFPVKEGGQTTTRTLRVPLLSLLPVPLQQIEQAEYEFYAQVNELLEPSQVKAYYETMAVKWPPFNAAATQTTPNSTNPVLSEDLSVTVAPYAGTTGNLNVPAMRVKLTLGQADLPSGIASTLRRIEETSGSNVTTVKKP